MRIISISTRRNNSRIEFAISETSIPMTIQLRNSSASNINLPVRQKMVVNHHVWRSLQADHNPRHSKTGGNLNSGFFSFTVFDEPDLDSTRAYLMTLF